MRKLLVLTAMGLGCMALGAGVGSATAGPAAIQPGDRPWIGPIPEAIQKLAGKRVWLMADVDYGCDLDGDCTPETRYLRALLIRVHADVVTFRGMGALKSGEVLVMGEPQIPDFSRDDREDPLKEAAYRQAVASLDAYAKEHEKWAAEAKAAGATVVQPGEVSTFFGLDKSRAGEIRRFSYDAFAMGLQQKLPEIKFDQIALADTIDYLRDVTGVDIGIDWAQLESVGIRRDTPVTLKANDLPLIDTLTRVLPKPQKGTLRVIVGMGQVLVTTGERADKLQAHRPLRWLTPDQLDHPPAEVLAPDPGLPASLRRRMPRMNFTGNALSDVLDFVRDVTEQKMEVDWEALATLKIEKDTPITMDIPAVPQHVFLRRLASSISGDAVFYVTKSGAFHLTTAAKAQQASDRQVLLEQ